LAELKEASYVGSDYDLTEKAEALKDCDVVFMAVLNNDAARFMQSANHVSDKIKAYYGTDIMAGIEDAYGFDINSISQEVFVFCQFAPLSDSAKAFDQKYAAKYSTDGSTEFAACAYDAVYAVYEALKFAKDNGKTVNSSMSAQEFGVILNDVFKNDSFVFKGITGADSGDGKAHITWNDNGTVNKKIVKKVIKTTGKGQMG